MSKLKRLLLMQPRSSAESQMEHRGPSAVEFDCDHAGLEREMARSAFKAWFETWIARNAASVELQRKLAAQYQRNGGEA